MTFDKEDLLATLPTDYLESYPFPAAVFGVGEQWLNDAQEERSKRRYDIVWSNEKWMGEETLNDVVGLNTFREWIGQEELEDSGDVFSLESLGSPLHLIRTTFPLNPPSNPSQDLRIVTSVQLKPHVHFATEAGILEHNHNHTLPTPHSLSSVPAPSQALRKSSIPDLTLSPLPLPTNMDCKYLLEHTDWSATAMGPRLGWSPVIEMMINVIMASPTQDSLWLGTDFQMI
ncbi:hypothetical protein CI109_103315 [Kwoniella shandongensis]|uniref:Uncharacterized protein n=1 Tax=Kwoniella shandongensis TaxID=1734106 RepID=A0AAJ8MVD1_9TREE